MRDTVAHSDTDFVVESKPMHLNLWPVALWCCASSSFPWGIFQGLSVYIWRPSLSPTTWHSATHEIIHTLLWLPELKLCPVMLIAPLQWLPLAENPRGIFLLYRCNSASSLNPVLRPSWGSGATLPGKSHFALTMFATRCWAAEASRDLLGGTSFFLHIKRHFRILLLMHMDTLENWNCLAELSSVSPILNIWINRLT